MTEFLITRTETVVYRATVSRKEAIDILVRSGASDTDTEWDALNDLDIATMLVATSNDDHAESAEVSSALASLAVARSGVAVLVDDWELTEVRP